MRLRVIAAVALALLAAPTQGLAFDVEYVARILPSKGIARLSIAIQQRAGEVTQLSFAFDAKRSFDAKGDGEVSVGDGRLTWRPPRGGGRLRYAVRVDNVRGDAEYDARLASTWMVARAEDLFPPMTATFTASAKADGPASLRFDLPPRWQVAHPFATRDGLAVIEQPGRRFAQPKGWIVAGGIERVEADVAGTRVLLAAPRRHAARLRDTLAFLRWTLPQLEAAFGPLPERVFVASADDPMWRGGLSAPGSVYVHADRPLIDDDASSPLLHELIHTITRARSAPGDDWIVEGVAERYSRETLRRSGAISQQTFERSLRALRDRAAGVDRLEGESTGAETALAVAFFEDLDRKIRKASGGAHSLDDVVVTMVGDPEPIDRAELATRILSITGFDASTLIEARIPGGG